MKNRRNKEEYGHQDYRRGMWTAMVTVGAAAILIQLATGGLTGNQAAENILTMIVVLSVPPTANLASPLLTSWRYRTPSEAFYQKVWIHGREFIILYDLIVTTEKSILSFDAVIVHPNGIYVYCTANKADGSKTERFLNTLLEGQKLDGNLKIIKNGRGFFHRVEGLRPTADYEGDGDVDYAANSLKNVSMQGQK